MVTLARRAARTPLAPVVAVMFGAVAAILVAAIPGWMFNSLVSQSGLPSIIRFAAPPLGLTARLLAAGLAFVVTCGVLWIVLSRIEKMLASRNNRLAWRDEGYVAIDEAVKVEGRRRPIFAPAELGAPLMSDEAIAVAPEPEIDQEPIFEPAVILEVEPELEIPLSAAEFDLPPSDNPDDDDNSIQSLIRRLESGLARRAANDPGPDSPTSAPSPLSLSSDWIVGEGNDTKTDNDDARTETRDDMRQALGALKRFASR